MKLHDTGENITPELMGLQMTLADALSLAAEVSRWTVSQNKAAIHFLKSGDYDHALHMMELIQRTQELYDIEPEAEAAQKEAIRMSRLHAQQPKG